MKFETFLECTVSEEGNISTSHGGYGDQRWIRSNRFCTRVNKYALISRNFFFFFFTFARTIDIIFFRRLFKWEITNRLSDACLSNFYERDWKKRNYFISYKFCILSKSNIWKIFFNITACVLYILVFLYVRNLHWNFALVNLNLEKYIFIFSIN